MVHLFPSLLLISGAAQPALADTFGEANLTGGVPEFGDCINSDRTDSSSCAWKFYHFLGGSMAEQGFTFQGEAISSSSAIQRETGWAVGARLDTFPFGPPPENLSGKAENTQFSPVLPRLTLAWLGGERIHWGAGLALLPPIPVGGASALLVSANGTAAWDLGRARLGLSADLTFTRARAPITASQEQFDDRESFENPDNLDPATFEAVCGADANGCLDTFVLLNPGLRGVAAVHLGTFDPYAILGLSFVNEHLTVMYDGTVWQLLALQPTISLGSAWSPWRSLTLSLGGSLAAHGPGQSGSGDFGVFAKAEGEASWRL